MEPLPLLWIEGKSWARTVALNPLGAKPRSSSPTRPIVDISAFGGTIEAPLINS
jgi:hypothetical protein